MIGLLNLNKPPALTSRDVVNQVSRLVRPSKCGHAGTLDPLATGVLIVCVGPATRLVPYLHRYSKTYVAEFCLGQRSTTDDIEGTVEEVACSSSITQRDLEDVLPEFLGEIQQVPPAYSAVRVNGRRAYQAARKGERVELAARAVQVHRLEIQEFEFPRLSLLVECGTGTYIRSLGRDIAERLGTAAVMSRLVRTRIGPFSIDESLTLEDLQSQGVESALRPIRMGVEALPHCCLSNEDVTRLRQGQRIPCSPALRATGSAAVEGDVAILDEQETLQAIARVRQDQLAPQVVFPNPESQSRR